MLKNLEEQSGEMSWTHREGDEYHVAGVDTYGKKFEKIYRDPKWELNTDLYCGTVWLVRNGLVEQIRRVEYGLG